MVCYRLVAMRHFASCMNFPARFRLRLSCRWKEVACRNWAPGAMRSWTDHAGFAASWSGIGGTALVVGLGSCKELCLVVWLAI